MRSRPEGVPDAAITSAVADGWRLTVTDLRYFPEGGGAYHWLAETGDRRWFVTCDDLDTKPWLGAERDGVFNRLTLAYQAAMDLRAAGLAFVAAPIASASGAPAQRVDDRYSVAVFEYVNGEPGVWGRPVEPQLRADVVAMLARLHQSSPSAHGVAPRACEVPGREALSAALDDVGRAWDGGPLSEAARRELAHHLDLVVDWLAALDRFVARLRDGPIVVTHGEPHPGNLIRADGGLVLVDWDTVALARPERDLWMLGGAGGAADYRRLTGVELDPDALAAYRLLWALTDVAAFTVQLRREHRQDADAGRALAGLRSIFSGREPSPYGR